MEAPPLRQPPTDRGQINRYSSTPRPRKVALFIVGIASLVNVILIVVCLVRPTPSFATSVLFRLRSDVEASITRRSLLVHPSSNNTGPSLLATPTPHVPEADVARKNRRSEYWISAGWNVQCKEEEGYMICQDFDPNCGCWRLRPPVVIIRTVTDYGAIGGEASTSYETQQTTLSAAPTTSASVTSSDTTSNSPSSTHSISQKTSSGANRTVESASPAATASRTGNDDEVDGSSDGESSANGSSPSWQGNFSGLWVGPMGACLEMRNRYRTCTSSFTPDFTTIYPESGLPPEVIDYLPTGTNGATVMLLLACVTYGIALVAFSLSYLPAVRARTRDGNRAYANVRYLWLLALATAATAGGVSLAFIAYLLTRRLAASATDNIPQLDRHLFVEGGGSTTPLLITVALGIINVLVGSFVVVQDLRLAWRVSIDSYHRREERKANAKRNRRWLRRRHSASNRHSRFATQQPPIPSRSHAPAPSRPPMMQMPQPVHAQPDSATEHYGQHLRPNDVPLSMQRPMLNPASLQARAPQPHPNRYNGGRTALPQGQQKTLWQRVTGG